MAPTRSQASTLAYAARARAITNAPLVNTDPRAAAVARLQREVASLRGEVARLVKLVRLGGGDPGVPLVASTRAAQDPLAKPSPCGSAAQRGGDRDDRSAGPRPFYLSPSIEPGQEVACDGMAADAAEAVQAGLEIARQLADTNGRLRTAFDALDADCNEVRRAHATLMTENDELRERLSLFELSLAMESYAVAPPDSLTAQIQTQLRAAALEAIKLRQENAELHDHLARTPGAVQTPRAVAPPPMARRQRSNATRNAPTGKCRSPAAAPVPAALALPVADAPARHVLSTTGSMHQTMRAPMSAGPYLEAHGVMSSCGSSRTPSTLEELDELSVLLRKKAALKAAERPATATVGAKSFGP